jgi:hypothetical protein
LQLPPAVAHDAVQLGDSFGSAGFEEGEGLVVQPTHAVERLVVHHLHLVHWPLIDMMIYTHKFSDDKMLTKCKAGTERLRTQLGAGLLSMVPTKIPWRLGAWNLLKCHVWTTTYWKHLDGRFPSAPEEVESLQVLGSGLFGMFGAVLQPTH